MKKIIFFVLLVAAGAAFVWYDVTAHIFPYQRYTPDITLGLTCTSNPTWHGRPLVNGAKLTSTEPWTNISDHYLVRYRLNGLPKSPTGKWCSKSSIETERAPIWYPTSSIFRAPIINAFTCVWVTKNNDGTPADYPACVGNVEIDELTPELRDIYRKDHTVLLGMNIEYFMQNEAVLNGKVMPKLQVEIGKHQDICKIGKACNGLSLDAYMKGFSYLFDPLQPEDSGESGYFAKRINESTVIVSAPLAETTEIFYVKKEE